MRAELRESALRLAAAREALSRAGGEADAVAARAAAAESRAAAAERDAAEARADADAAVTAAGAECRRLQDGALLRALAA
jgi:hypothetical protein